MIRLFLFLVILVGVFFLGYVCGMKNIFSKKESFDTIKKYTIEFEKANINNTVKKDSYLIKTIVDFCESIGIEIVNLEISTFGRGELVVNCNKNQHYLLIRELSKNEHMIDIRKVDF